MKFTTSYNPATMNFSMLTKKELKEFYEWFMLNLPYCIEELIQLVRTSPGFENWWADETPQSLDALGDWLSRKIQKHDLTTEEVFHVKNFYKGDVEVPSWELNEKSRSLAVYIGMYYGEVIIKNNPGLRWEQKLGRKSFADFGQPVISGGRAVPINPVRVASSFACGVVSGKSAATGLREAYEYWVKLALPAAK